MRARTPFFSRCTLVRRQTGVISVFGSWAPSLRILANEQSRFSVFQASTELSATSVGSQSSTSEAAPEAMRDQRSRSERRYQIQSKGRQPSSITIPYLVRYGHMHDYDENFFPDKAEEMARISLAELETKFLTACTRGWMSSTWSEFLTKHLVFLLYSVSR